MQHLAMDEYADQQGAADSTTTNDNEAGQASSLTAVDANDDMPVKRGRGRPRTGRAPPAPAVLFRCRYCCIRGIHKHISGAVGLRKHMARVHAIFSNHKGMKYCKTCEIMFNPAWKDLRCADASRHCKKPVEGSADWLDHHVLAPRDEQEEADTWAYAHSGPNAKGPSALVIVLPEHVEEERREACKKAHKNWTLMPSTPGSTEEDAISIGDDEDEQLPAPPVPAYKGKGKKRAIDALFSAPAPVSAPKRVAHEVVPDYLLSGFNAVVAGGPVGAGQYPAGPTYGMNTQQVFDAGLSGTGYNNGTFGAGYPSAPPMFDSNTQQVFGAAPSDTGFNNGNFSAGYTSGSPMFDSNTQQLHGAGPSGTGYNYGPVGTRYATAPPVFDNSTQQLYGAGSSSTVPNYDTFTVEGDPGYLLLDDTDWGSFDVGVQVMEEFVC